MERRNIIGYRYAYGRRSMKKHIFLLLIITAALLFSFLVFSCAGSAGAPYMESPVLTAPDPSIFSEEDQEEIVS